MCFQMGLDRGHHKISPFHLDHIASALCIMHDQRRLELMDESAECCVSFSREKYL